MAASGKHGSVTALPVPALQPGQRVWTIDGGQSSLTKVIHNTRIGGSFSFVHVTAKDSYNLTHKATVTHQHNFPRMHHTAVAEHKGNLFKAVDENSMEVVQAQGLVLGDLIPVLGPHGPSLARITSLAQSKQHWKNVLVTDKGTVLTASGILTTTVCDGATTLPKAANFSEAMLDWRKVHKPIFDTVSFIV